MEDQTVFAFIEWFLLGLFLLFGIGGFLIGRDDEKKKQQAAQNKSVANTTLPEDIKNSDGKPDLPFNSK